MPEQQEFARGILHAGLSRRGYLTASTIIELVLRETGENPAVRDPELCSHTSRETDSTRRASPSRAGRQRADRRALSGPARRSAAGPPASAVVVERRQAPHPLTQDLHPGQRGRPRAARPPDDGRGAGPSGRRRKLGGVRGREPDRGRAEASQAWFYRTSAGAEIDLVVEVRSGERWAIEVKRSSAPAASRGFRSGCDDIRATRRLVVYPGDDAFPLGGDVEAVGLLEAVRRLRKAGPAGE